MCYIWIAIYTGYWPSSVISVLMTALGTRFLMAPKNSVYVLISSVSVIPHATGRPDELKKYNYYIVNTCA